jgi:hypothetical protein
MSKSHLIIFSVVAGFIGFLLGYSAPPIIENRISDGVDEVTIEKIDSEGNQEMSDYYKQLQELK